MVTIKDVAKRAGVSVATVSRVINGVPTVNEKMKLLVEETIEKMGYMPNQVAKSLKNNVTNTIGIVVSDISDPFMMSVIRIVEKGLRAKGYSLLIASTDDDETKEKEIINMMYAKCVDGLIVSPVSHELEDLLKPAICPVVAFDRNPVRQVCDMVYVDKEKAMYDAVQYLLRQGHTNIAMVSGKKVLTTNFDRYNGYLRAFFENDQVALKENFMFGSFSKEYGMQAFKELAMRKNPPTAIVSGSASITEGILVQAKKMGIRVPDDVSLVSFGAVSFQDLIDMKITHSVEMEEEIGRIISQMMLARLKNYDLPWQVEVLESRIIEGDSVRAIR